MSLMDVLTYIGLVIIFPGFVFTTLIGMVSSWIDRKVSARLQWRVGPPWYQPIADIVKLMGKETVVVEGAARFTFLSAPYIGFAAVVVVSTMIWMASIRPQMGFVGDLIVILYLLYIPSLAMIVGGSASRNPYSALGASREMKLMLAYELSFLIAVFTLVVNNGGIISLGGMVAYQQASGPMVSQGVSNIIALVVALVYVPAKLGIGPFDIPEAECELIAGPYTEYSGSPLAAFKLTKLMLLCALPVLVVTMFATSAWTPWAILWYVLILVFVILIKNTNPRLRIDQALRFFWGPVLILSLVGIVLAAIGL
ncbi:MAG: NADH-quinone oxidoreductase subunit H [Dehalococcoidia bacterium]|nr:NADH-quinone oxidoreductase subunit H [Dehalococcoidia bacterium]